MKTSSEIIDALNVLEQQFPVSTWCCGDIHLWPVYRFRLYGNAIDRILLTESAPRALSRFSGLVDRAARALWRVPLASWQDSHANAPFIGGVDAVFLSDGVSFTSLNGRWVDRIVDPVMQALDQSRLRGLKLTLMSEAHVPRDRPSRFVQPTIDRIKFLATHRRPMLDLPQWTAFEQAAQGVFGAAVPSVEWLQVQTARLDALARWFGARLERSGARCAFVNTYYSLEGQAFVLAARRLRLMSVDLQHGIQGEHHVAYARWLQVPASGYSTLPDEFWVWSEEEARAIDLWSVEISRHKARVTGNSWMQYWSDDANPQVAKCMAEAAALRQSGHWQVLACLSWGLADEETDKLIQAARQCDTGVSWWWRLHPVEAGSWSEFSRRLRRHGLKGSQVGATTDLPLYALIRNADALVAHSSTVIQEAAQLGVPSVVTSDYGAEFHSKLMRAGHVVKATDPVAIAKAVESLAFRDRIKRPIASSPDQLQAAVDTLFS